ncbi:MAG TPA: Nramp family divalent metal transporter [Candidatus Saccharibacteria bacterium]|nr:Nramp family divalent metal transporter [Candidatus Saccharibacteria bacterium]
MVRQTRKVAAMLGPAFVAAVAYVDPGNFAANFSAGAQYGYLLLWVLVVANLMAMMVQYLSAKVGIVTGKTLPEVVAEKLPTWPRRMYWAQAELVAISCDIAEIVGGAIALNILFQLPLVAGGLITGLVSMLLLVVYQHPKKLYFERMIISLMCIIPIGFIVGLFMQPADPVQLIGGLVPRFDGTDTILLATAMLGATIMPHVVYLHSALARDRHGKVATPLVNEYLRATRIDVGIAMLFAGSVNIAMLVLAASALNGLPGTDTLQGIYQTLGTQLSPLVALLFAISLLVSGFASTSVGSQAGAVIMQGLLQKRISLFMRRIITLIPALIVLAGGIDPTFALILSQIGLSFGVPFALVPLVLITGSKTIMGKHVNQQWVNYTVAGIAGIVSVLNVVLIWLTIAG